MVMGMTETTKTCKVCQRAKPLDAFYVTKYGAAGRRGTCKVCTKIKARPARVDQIRRQNLKNYGMTIAEYDALFAAQDGRCAICDEPEKIISRNGQPFRLAVDHDHQTGAARGLLCALCNRMVGHLESRADMVSRMQAYLAQHKVPGNYGVPPDVDAYYGRTTDPLRIHEPAGPGRYIETSGYCDRAESDPVHVPETVPDPADTVWTGPADHPGRGSFPMWAGSEPQEPGDDGVPPAPGWDPPLCSCPAMEQPHVRNQFTDCNAYDLGGRPL